MVDRGDVGRRGPGRRRTKSRWWGRKPPAGCVIPFIGSILPQVSVSTKTLLSTDIAIDGRSSASPLASALPMAIVKDEWFNLTLGPQHAMSQLGGLRKKGERPEYGSKRALALRWGRGGPLDGDRFRSAEARVRLLQLSNLHA